MNLNLILQVTDVAEIAEATVEMNYWDLALKGGWIMIPLFALFLAAVYIFVERIVFIKSSSKTDPTFMNRIKDFIFEGKIDSALNLCRQTNTPSARMIEKGITRLGRPMEDVLVAIENVGNLEVAKLEKRLPFLATIAGGAPMLGFLGTVTGMIRAFFDMASYGNEVNMSVLSKGLYEAMVTTVAGLIVGIIAFFMYNYLVTRVSNAIGKMEANSLEFLDILNEPA